MSTFSFFALDLRFFNGTGLRLCLALSILEINSNLLLNSLKKSSTFPSELLEPVTSYSSITLKSGARSAACALNLVFLTSTVLTVLVSFVLESFFSSKLLSIKSAPSSASSSRILFQSSFLESNSQESLEIINPFSSAYSRISFTLPNSL